MGSCVSSHKIHPIQNIKNIQESFDILHTNSLPLLVLFNNTFFKNIIMILLEKNNIKKRIYKMLKNNI